MLPNAQMTHALLATIAVMIVRCNGAESGVRREPENLMSAQPQWWGHNKEHGWVVLDREVPCNVPGTRSNLLFLRCRDGKAFDLKWELWNRPAYQYAPNYIRSLEGESAAAAADELEALMARWPELSQTLRTQYDAIVAEQRAADRRKIEGEGPTVKKPRRTASRALKAVPASDQ